MHIDEITLPGEGSRFDQIPLQRHASERTCIPSLSWRAAEDQRRMHMQNHEGKHGQCRQPWR